MINCAVGVGRPAVSAVKTCAVNNGASTVRTTLAGAVKTLPKSSIFCDVSCRQNIDKVLPLADGILIIVKNPFCKKRERFAGILSCYNLREIRVNS